MDIRSRVSSAFSALFGRPVKGRVDFDLLSNQLDQIIADKNAAVETKQTSSKLAVRTNDTDLAYSNVFYGMRLFAGRSKTAPAYGDPARDMWLDDFWKTEPILAGAIYSMTAKMMSLKWTIIGKRRQAFTAASMLASAAHMGGNDWGGFIASTANDFYTKNRGAFWEVVRGSSRPTAAAGQFGYMTELGHIDALACTLTGNADKPVVYQSEVTGQTIRFKPGEFIHFSSLPSPRELNLGIGFCAVDRAMRAAKLLVGLHDYDEEKLNNLPPEGVASISGMTMEEVNDAILLWKTKRESDDSLTFPQVLWLIGTQPNAEVKVVFTPFSTIPESFDRKSVVDQYVSTLALCFGVDAREFWPISSGALGTASESEIQHLKAKGKGPGEFISTTERYINSELPDGVDFAYDTQDIEEDMTAAAVTKAWVDAFYPLYTGTPAGKSKASPSGKPNTEAVPNREEVPDNKGAQSGGGQPFGAAFGAPQPEQVVTKDQLLRLLADKGVLPDWLLSDDRLAIEDSGIHLGKESSEEYSRFEWDGRVLKETRLPPIVIHKLASSVVPYGTAPLLPATTTPPNGRKNGHSSTGASDEDNKYEIALSRMKEVEDQAMAAQRNIHGDPIPDHESTRGTKITKRTIRDELERWRGHPVLSQYVPDIEEELAAIQV